MGVKDVLEKVQLNRRQLFQASIGLTAALKTTACGHLGSVPHRSLAADPFGLPWSGSFPLGLSVGDVTTQSARVVSRYLGSTSAELRVLEQQMDGSLTPIMASPMVTNDGGFISADVSGLQPSRRYVYAFLEADQNGEMRGRSVVGQFKTPPPDNATPPLLITASSCARQRFGFDTLARAAEVDADLHVLLGDTSYNDGCLNMQEFRSKWASSLEREEYVLLRSATSVIAAWDDHEVQNNWEPSRLTPEVIEAGQKAFLEHVPVRMPARDRFSIYRSVKWGGTAEFFILDLYSEQDRANNRFISQEQLDWLINGVQASTAVFKVIVNSIPISNTTPPFHVFREGRWEGFSDQREDLLNRLEKTGVPGIFFIAGDVHMPVIGHVDRHAPGQNFWEIMVGPAAHAVNPLWVTMGPPQFEWAGSFVNIAAMRFEPATREVTVSFIDKDGDVRVTRTLAL